MMNANPTDVIPDFSGLNNQTDIAVGLSGGGDSMALTHMVCLWAQANNKTIHALTVDHVLRNDSAEEAALVVEWVKDFPNIHHVVLKCDWHEKPQTAVMEKARNARYDLMARYCRDHGIPTLCIAHHADDQLETFLFRLAKGSGLDGLTGMTEWSDLNENTAIFRPLLNVQHQQLIDYCIDQKLNWIEDPSNRDERFARPRLRQALMEEGLDSLRFSKTLHRLSRAKDVLDWITDQARSDVLIDGKTIDYKALISYPFDIQIRVLQAVIAEIGDVTHNYPPKLERVEDILATIKPSKSATLHGCVLSLSSDGKTLAVKGASA
jgi:tRNA(Ile)-lysidine synthase